MKAQIGYNIRSKAGGLLAIAGAFALALASTVTVAPLASAATSATPPTVSGAPSSGTLTLTKLSGSETGNTNDGTEQNVSGEPLEGVTFSVTPVTEHNGNAIDLTSASGWQLIEGATVDTVQNSGTYTFGSALSITTNSSGVATTSLPLGLYLVQETSSGSNSVVSPVAPFLVTIPLFQKGSTGTWLYDVHAYPKNQELTNPTKTVSTPASELNGPVTWTVRAPIPTLNTTDSLTSFSITDTLDSRLEYIASSATLEVNGASLTTGTDYTLNYDSGSRTLTAAFTTSGLTKISDLTDTDAVLTFKTTVTGVGQIPNTAYSNINGNTLETTPVRTNWGKLTIEKVDAASSSTKLHGAQFSLYASDPSSGSAASPVATETTDADGALTFSPLWAGNGSETQKTYWLVETRAPDGYVVDPTPIKVQVVANTETSTVVKTVTNRKPLIPGLPLTGASGTYTLLGIGAGLIALALGSALMLRARRRKS